MSLQDTDAIAEPSSRHLWFGALAWVAVSIVLVVIHGPAWDESHEHAQVLLGDVVYPDGHPFKQYVLSAYTVQHYLTAALMLITRDPVWICGFRSALSVGLILVPVFLLCAAVTGRTLLAHALTLLALSGAPTHIDNVYQLTIWWNTYSNGQVGMGFSLLALALAALHRWRTAAFLAGLGPLIHLGQWPPVLGLMLVAGLCALRLGRTRVLIQCVPWFVAGLLACAVFAALQRLWVPAPPETGPYAIPADAQTILDIWRGFVFFVDGHRDVPPLLTVAMGSLPALLGGAILLTRPSQSDASRSALAWVWVYATGTWVVVTGIAVAHVLLGNAIPPALIAWIPYRLYNHLLVLGLVVVAAGCTRACSPRTTTHLTWIVVIVALLPAMAAVIDTPIARRYVTGGEAGLFVAYGLGVGTWITSLGGRARILSAIGALTLGAVVTALHRFGGLCVLMALPLPFVLSLITQQINPVLGAAVAGAAMLAALGVVWGLRDGGYHGPRMHTAWHAAAVADFERVPDDGRLVLGRPIGPIMQPRFSRPFFAGHVTPSYISYMPALGPAIDAMYNDAYGMPISYGALSDVADAERSRPFLSRIHTAWTNHWASMTLADWQALGTKYGIGYVLVPADADLRDLPIDRISDRPDAAPFALYRIPPGEETYP